MRKWRAAEIHHDKGHAYAAESPVWTYKSSNQLVRTGRGQQRCPDGQTLQRSIVGVARS
jgi:hypothetical protein